MRRLRIEHVTEFDFDGEVSLLPHQLRLRPRESHALRILRSSLDITPAATVRWQSDVHSNSVAHLTFKASTRRLCIISTADIEHYEETPLDFLIDSYAVDYPFDYTPADQLDLAPLRGQLWPGDRASVQAWLISLGIPRPGEQTFSVLDRINREIANNFRYTARDVEGVQSPALTLSLRSGSCRDFATLFMEAVHSLGLAARFVSGYQITQLNIPGSTHAWVEVYVPGPGWKGFDPSAGLVTGTQHIAVAVARHPELVPPVAGNFFGAVLQRPSMRVTVNVRELPPVPVAPSPYGGTHSR
ncbi:MAG: hypothetical protein RL385_4627 [Pseudomonadota bacterium]